MQTSAPEAVAAERPAVFKSVICGVDGSDADAVAVRQAAIFAGREARLELVSVVEKGISETAQILLTPERAHRALRRAYDIAVDNGLQPEMRLAEARWAEPDLLLDEAAKHDLLVVGTHGRRRIDGILAGSTTTAAVHRAPCPVLIARPGGELPGRVLLADDGTTSSHEAARLAGAIAARHSCEVLVAAPAELDAERRRRLAEDCVTLQRLTGREPVVVDVEGPAAQALSQLAERLGTSLLVLGSRRLHGIKALPSVSERVAHTAPCSVLVVRS